jgi:3-hydroxyacyl-[acyl-carrier-protein] dehydratase
MSQTRQGELLLGTNVVALLLPHGRPLLLVDQITGFADNDLPELRGNKFISGNDPVFAGHFPHLHLWPGIFTIEGLGQCCQLLYVIRAARQSWSAQGGDPDDVIKGLLNLERGTRMHPGFDAALAGRFLREAVPLQDRIGVSSAVDIKFLHPVFAGVRLDYQVRLSRILDQHVRFEVAAEVDGRQVARGVMTSYVGYLNPMPIKAP